MTAYRPRCYYGTGHGSAQYRGTYGTLCWPCYRAHSAVFGDAPRPPHASTAITRLQRFVPSSRDGGRP